MLVGDGSDRCYPYQTLWGEASSAQEAHKVGLGRCCHSRAHLTALTTGHERNAFG